MFTRSAALRGRTARFLGLSGLHVQIQFDYSLWHPWHFKATSLATWPGDKESPRIHGTMGRDADTFFIKNDALCMGLATNLSRFLFCGCIASRWCPTIPWGGFSMFFVLCGSCLVVSCHGLPCHVSPVVHLDWQLGWNAIETFGQGQFLPKWTSVFSSACFSSDTWRQGHKDEINMYIIIYIYI